MIFATLGPRGMLLMLQINVPRARIARENLVPQHILSKIGHSQIEAAWLQFFS